MISRSARLIATPAALVALGLSATILVSATSGAQDENAKNHRFRITQPEAVLADEHIVIDPPANIAALDIGRDRVSDSETDSSHSLATASKSDNVSQNSKEIRVISAKKPEDSAASSKTIAREKPRFQPSPVPQSFGEWLVSESRILIDQSQRLLYFKRENGAVDSALIAVGRDGYFTPTGQFEVQQIRRNPSWYPTPSMKREAIQNGELLPDSVPPGPQNPLGKYFIRFQPEYGIHGTNEPGSIGQAISRGCVRMLNEDVSRLASSIAVGDGVTIVRQFKSDLPSQPLSQPDYFYEPYVEHRRDPTLAPLYTMPNAYGG